jgi:uncharacterized surface anchored protein
VAIAQTITTGMVAGKIQDATGAILGGASVRIVNLQTSQSRETVADASGRFLFAGLEPGDFRVTATSPGFPQDSSSP